MVIVMDLLFVPQASGDGGADFVQIFVFGQDAVDFADDFSVWFDDDGGGSFLACQLESSADDIMVAGLFIRQREFLRVVQIEQDEGTFGDLLEITSIQNGFTEADGGGIPVRASV